MRSPGTGTSGWGNQLLLIALALGIIVVVVWGYRMWWLRRPTRPGARAPGGTERPGIVAVATVGLLAVVLGVFLPVLGVSLLVFLLADVVRGEFGRRRDPSPDRDGPRGRTAEPV